jgi:hypothetical protein
VVGSSALHAKMNIWPTGVGLHDPGDNSSTTVYQWSPQTFIMMRGIFCKTCSLFRLPLLCHRDARDTSSVHWTKYKTFLWHLFAGGKSWWASSFVNVSRSTSPYSWCLVMKIFCLSLNGGKLYWKLANWWYVCFCYVLLIQTPNTRRWYSEQIYKKVELCCHYLLPYFYVRFHFMFQFLSTKNWFVCLTNPCFGEIVANSKNLLVLCWKDLSAQVSMK